MPDQTAYSPLKIFHHQDRLASMCRGEYLAPIRIQLVPTNRCNQGCKGCAYRIEGYPSNQLFALQSEIPWDKLSEVINDCQRMHVKAIEVTGGGEPTVHPQFLEMCKLILDRGIDLGLATNGARWDKEHTQVLSQAKWVRFSIDSGSPETYASYRRSNPRVYHEVREHIKSLTSSKTRCPESIVGIGFVVNLENWQEVVVAAKRAQEDGADNFRISALFQNKGALYFNSVYPEIRDLCRKAEELTTGTFKVFNLFGDRIQDLNQCSPDYSTCWYAQLTTYLGADCVAYTCCNNAYNDRGIIGSFRDQSFRNMWFLDATKRNVLGTVADECPLCMYNNKNKSIAYAVNNKPQHVNFI